MTHLDPARFCRSAKRPSVVYCYGDGAPLGAVARFEAGVLGPKKEFIQYRLVGGRWVAGLDGLKLPLYRLPEIVAAVQQLSTIYLPEGEKCADLLVGYGFDATTNSGGAGQWTAEHAETLRNATVVIIPDHDEAGRRHGEHVAASLHGVAKAVFVLSLPGLKEGEDVVEWFARGGTAELLSELAASAPVWAPRIESCEAWPDPVAFATCTEPIPFPIETALPPELRDYAEHAARTVRVDVAVPSALVPAVLSAAAGNAYSVRASRQHTERNLSRYVAQCLFSGERKTAIYSLVTEPLSSFVDAEMPRYERERRAYEDNLEVDRRRRKKAIGAAVKAGSTVDGSEPLVPSRPPRRPLAFLGDTTMPELVRRMDANGGATALFSGDARHIIDIILGQHRPDGQCDDSVLLRAHGGDVVDRARVGNGVSEYIWIARPALAMGMAIQPDKLEQLINRKGTASSGLLARINLSCPHSLVGERIETGDEQPMPHELAAEFEARVHAIMRARFELIDASAGGPLVPIELQLDAKSRELRRHFFNEFELQSGEDKPLADVQSFVSKLAGETVRLAALFHLYELARQGRLSDAESVAVPHKTWALAEVHQRWQFWETVRVLQLASESVQERTARRLLAWAGTLPIGQIVAARDAIAARRVSDTSEFDKVLQLLQERRWVRKIAPKGREREARWEFHPKTWDGRS